MIRDYIVGQSETLTLISIGTADGSNQFIKVDGVLVNGFCDLVLYSDASGTTAVPEASYDMTTIDIGWTSDEAQTGGTGKTVYSQFKVTNVSYQNIPLYATFTNFGVYTSADANFLQQGGVISVSTTSEITIPEGYLSVLVDCDTTAGNITLTSSNAGFAGQKIRVKNSSGTGLVYCKLPGAYLGGAGTGTPISEGLMWRGDSDGTVIDPVNEVTADYVSSSWDVFKTSQGNQRQRARLTKNNGLTTEQIFFFPEPFTATPRITVDIVGAGERTAYPWGVDSTTLEVRSLVMATGALTSVDRIFDTEVKGKY